MLRQMIHIDEDKCDGCGMCIAHCAEGAIALVDAKAKVIREDYCDGLGACLPACPREALTLRWQDAPEFTDPLVNPSKKNWPLQLQLSPLTSLSYHNASLLICADCTAFASPLEYDRLSKSKAVLIVCPKFDKISIPHRLAAILKANDIVDISVLRMAVPCCGALERFVKEAMLISGKSLPIVIHVMGKEGKLIG
jgi:Pyruvate/2-oxoacid:ferredoxin oxidoreductase delta subunit